MAGTGTGTGTLKGTYGDLLQVSRTDVSSLCGFEGVKVVEFVSGFGRTFALTEPGLIKLIRKVDEAQAGRQLNHSNVERGRLELELSSLETESLSESVEFCKAAVGRSCIVAISKSDKTLYSIGSSEAGELGLGHTKHSFKFRRVIGTNDRKFKDIACGDGHAMALSEDGGVYTWGKGFCGQLGHGTLSKSIRNFSAERLVRSVPRFVQALVSTKVSKIACGDAFSCALSDTGHVWCWGEGRLGQLGDGNHKNRCIPVKVLGPAVVREESSSPTGVVVDVSCGGAHALARDDSGQVFSWGFNYYGQLGLRDCLTRRKPEKLAAETFFASITADANSSAAVCVKGVGWQWGLTEGGHLSTPTALQFQELDLIGLLQAGKNPVALVPLSISALSPEIGSKLGGTKIMLSGKGLWNSTSWTARFTSQQKPQLPETTSIDIELTEETEGSTPDPDNSWSNIEPQLSEIMPIEERSSYSVPCKFEDGRLKCNVPSHHLEETMIVEVTEDGETFLPAANNFEYVPDIEISSFSPKNCCTSDGSEENMPLVFSVGAKNVRRLSTAVLRFASGETRFFDIPVKRYLSEGSPSEERQIEFCIDPKALFRRLRGAKSSEYGMLTASVSLSNNKQEFFGMEEKFHLANVEVSDLTPHFYCIADNTIDSELSCLRVAVKGAKDLLDGCGSVLLRFKHGSQVGSAIQSTSLETLPNDSMEAQFQVAGMDVAELGLTPSSCSVTAMSQVQFSFNSGLDWITYGETVCFYQYLPFSTDIDMFYETGGMLDLPLSPGFSEISCEMRPAAKLWIEPKKKGELYEVEIEHVRSEDVLRCHLPAVTKAMPDERTADPEEVYSGELVDCDLQIALNGTDFVDVLQFSIMRLPHFVKVVAVQDEELKLQIEVTGRGFVKVYHMKIEVTIVGPGEDGDSEEIEQHFSGMAQLIEAEERMKPSKSKKNKTLPEADTKTDNMRLVCSLTMDRDFVGFGLSSRVSFNGIHFIDVKVAEDTVIQRA